MFIQNLQICVVVLDSDSRKTIPDNHEVAESGAISLSISRFVEPDPGFGRSSKIFSEYDIAFGARGWIFK
jgi:hypothetical protein